MKEEEIKHPNARIWIKSKEIENKQIIIMQAHKHKIKMWKKLKLKVKKCSEKVDK